MLKRHMVLKQAVDDYAGSIQKLSDRAQKMFAEDHPDGFVLKFNMHVSQITLDLHVRVPLSPISSAARRSSGGRARWTNSTQG